MNNIIGVDLGGTNVRAGLISGNEIVDLHTVRINSKGSVEEVVDQVFGVIDDLDRSEVKGIGIGVPSVVDVENGIVFDVQNIPSWKRVGIKDILEDKYGVEVRVNNDANCFAMADFQFGKGRGFKNVIGLIMGTGLAGGVIINGSLYEGVNCGAGEFGMIGYRDSIYEHYCCGQFFQRQYQLEGQDVAQMAQDNNPQGLKIMEEFGGHVGQVVSTILYAHDPEIIILGGSVSKSYSLFENALWKVLENFGYPNSIKNLKIEVSDLENPGVFGAAALVMA